MTLLEALEAALEIEHQVVYGYGAVGARLAGALQTSAADALATHQRRRDALAAGVRAAGGHPGAGEVAYALPFPVHDVESAATLGCALESSASQALWDLIAVTRSAGSRRRLAVQWLAESARLLDEWTLVSGRHELVALPGQPPASQPSTTPTSSAS